MPVFGPYEGRLALARVRPLCFPKEVPRLVGQIARKQFGLTVDAIFC